MFTRDNIIEGMISRPQIVDIHQNTVRQILADAGIKSSIVSIGKPHTWVMQSQHVWLDDGRCLLLKIGVNPDWTDASTILNQVRAAEIIRSTGIEQPNILLYSDNIDDYGFMFILSEKQSGICLCDIYEQASKFEREQIYRALGKAYSKIHSIGNEWAGVWDGDSCKKKYPIHPSEFYSYAEIHNGSAKYLLENNVISIDIFDAICSVWNQNLNYLKQRPNSLVHVSPFPWSIYMLQSGNRYTVGGLTALADFMWWDSMSDVAHLLYPPFLNITKEERNAFISEYNMPLDEYAINIYMLLNRVCAMSGCYLSPTRRDSTDMWIKQEVRTIKESLDKLKSMKAF